MQPAGQGQRRARAPATNDGPDAATAARASVGDFIRFGDTGTTAAPARLNHARRVNWDGEPPPADRAGVSTAATAQLVVPRSMPIRNGPACHADLTSRMFNSVSSGDVRVAPELEGADFGDATLQRHGDSPRRAGRSGAARVPERTDLRTSPQSSMMVPGGSALRIADEKPELRRLSDRQSELTAGDRRARSLFHPERHDARAFSGAATPVPPAAAFDPM